MKQPKKKPDTSDRHRSGFMIRLPENYREVIRRISRKNRRTITGELLIGIDRHIKSEGEEPPALALD